MSRIEEASKPGSAESAGCARVERSCPRSGADETAATDPATRDLFEAALDLASDARAAFLATRCSDAGIRLLVERMLAAHESTAGLLDMAVESVANRLDGGCELPQPAAWLGRMVGGFRLTDVLGQGGSAVVFRAERTRHGVTQVVALKLLRQLLLSDFALRQFRRERAAMARLTHPNIARLIDGGTTDDGIAYIVIELVDGERLTEYARRIDMDGRARVSLMVQVCRAVDSAHRALIVHRDLKPSNVLVTREGFVKLLDFGIAKFLCGEDDATEQAGGALTPAYAAPEQFRGGAITMATDVFSLGVLLRELLAPDADALDRVGRRALMSRARGDIDGIIFKATACKADERYRSAGALADDLECFLASKPVAAHPPSWVYCARKFCVRHWLLVAVLSAACLLVSAAVAAALWQARVAVRSASLAQQEAAAARATRDFVVDVFRGTEPGGPRAAPVTVVEVIGRALARVDGDRGLGLRASVDLRTQLGAVLAGQGQREAVTVLRATFEDANRSLAANDPMRIVAGHELASALIAAGDFGSAGVLLRDLEDDLHGLQPERLARQEILASLVEEHRGRAGAATSRIDRAIAYCDDGCGNAVKFDALTTQAGIYGTFERYRESAAAWERALSIARESHGPIHANVARAMTGLNGAYRRLGRLEEAKRLALEVLEIDDRIQLPEFHAQRALHLHHLGNAHFFLGEFTAAEQAFERALEIRRTAFGEDSETLDADLHNLGAVNNRLGRFDRAIEYLEESLRRQIAHNGESGRGAAYSRLILGITLALQGNDATAMLQLDRAVADLGAAGEGSRDLWFDARRYRARVLAWSGQRARALEETTALLAMIARGDVHATEGARLHATITHAVAMAEGPDTEAATALLRSSLDALARLDLEHESQAYGQYRLAAIEAHRGACAESQARLDAARGASGRIPHAYAYLDDARRAANRALVQGCR